MERIKFVRLIPDIWLMTYPFIFYCCLEVLLHLISKSTNGLRSYIKIQFLIYKMITYNCATWTKIKFMT